MKKKIILYLAIFLALIPNNMVFAKSKDNLNSNQTLNNKNVEYHRATVREVEEVKDEFGAKTKRVVVEINDGYLKGKTVEINIPVFSDVPYMHNYREGDQVVVFKDKNGDSKGFNILDHYRMTWIYYLLGAFVIVVLIIGRKSGLKSIFSLFISIVMAFVMLPLLAKGKDPILITLIASSINTIITILVIGGASKKSLAAIISTIIGLALSFGLVSLFASRTYISGLSIEGAPMLMLNENSISVQKLVFASIILGSLGAIMDVTVSIASSIEEVRRAKPSAKTMDLYKSGMNVGRDVMGTMSNTLVLAYFASSMPLALMIYMNNTGSPYFYNMEIFVLEMLRSLIGSIALVLVIPITCIVASVLYKSKKVS